GTRRPRRSRRTRAPWSGPPRRRSSRAAPPGPRAPLRLSWPAAWGVSPPPRRSDGRREEPRLGQVEDGQVGVAADEEQGTRAEGRDQVVGERPQHLPWQHRHEALLGAAGPPAVLAHRDLLPRQLHGERLSRERVERLL